MRLVSLTFLLAMPVICSAAFVLTPTNTNRNTGSNFLKHPLLPHERKPSWGLSETAASRVDASGTSSTHGQQQQQQQQQQKLPTTTAQTQQQQQRTLYDVLGASPTETRAELKQRYVELARQTHPDALVGTAQQEKLDLEFSEIAAAWRILGDAKERKRYDRSLRAERLSDEIVSWAADVTSQARPAAEIGAELFEKIAIPFLRRTTATTLATFQAAAAATSHEKNMAKNNQGGKEQQQQQQQQPRSFRQTFQTAMDAARRAGRAVDKMEMLEKIQDLEAQAVKEYQNAMDMQTKLKELVDTRLKLSLHTPSSGLTSCEALILLEEYNQTVADHLSVWDRARLRNTVEHEIKELQRIETDFVEAQRLDSQCQEEYREYVREQMVARGSLNKAEKELEAARLAYEAAQQRVLQCRNELDNVSRELATSENRAKKSGYDIERRSTIVEHQAEKVRHALRLKEQEVCRRQGGESCILEDAPMADELEQRLKRLEEMRQDERQAAEIASQFEMKATRLLSRANKLKLQAKELEEI